MKKTKLLAGAVVAVIGGLAMTSIASATTVTPLVGETVNYTLNGSEEFSAGVLEINDGETKIYILDRNLGATSNDINNTGSYGYHFQWGNNYGFSPYITPSTSTTQVQASSLIYDPLHQQYYSSSQFFKDVMEYYGGNWLNNNSIVDLWGGSESDTNSLSYPLTAENAASRRGPCPEGFHVPSRGELDKIANMMNNNGGAIHDELLVPFAGVRTYNVNNVSVVSLGNYAVLWSSSPYGIITSTSYSLSFSVNGGVETKDADRALGISIRCVHDFYDTYTKSVSYIEPIDTDIQVTVGQTQYNGLPNTMTVTTNNVQQVNNKPVLGEVSVSFGSNESAKFSKPVKINIPVAGNNEVVVKVKHAGASEYNYDGLTTNVNASCSNGTPTSSQYNGEPLVVVDGYASIYTCEASSFVALDVPPTVAQINLAVLKGTLTIGVTTSSLNLGQVNVSNSAQELVGSFGANSFWVEDMKGLESGYSTTISVTDLNGTVAGHSISADNISLKTAGATPSHIAGASVDDSQVVFGAGIKDWHSGSGEVNYFQRLNTATADAGRVGKWGDNLQIKVTIPAHTPYDTYRGTITYTLYDNDIISG